MSLRRSEAMLLEVRNAVVHYGSVEALHGVSLGLDHGMLISLIGANGAGKTTTLRTISGLKKPTSGQIWFEGQRIDGLPPEEVVKRGIAQVPEGRRVFPRMTVLENLEMGAYLRRDPGGVRRDLDLVYSYFPILAARAKQRAGSLSGGEQQMLATARALMANPTVILMDEPSLGLSPLMTQMIAQIVKDINRDGNSIVLVEQNAMMALGLAQRSYVLETGNVVLEGEAKYLMADERVKSAYLGG